MTGALFLFAETVVGQAIEPLIYGHRPGLSPVAVITAATFWTWLWGPIGLILAIPLTMCLVVLGRHVDQLKFLEVMFGDEPPLTPAELIYQRMLARDPVEAADQARIFLKEKPLTAYYDEILLEGLRLAQVDAQRGSLDEDQMRRIRDAVAELVDDLATHTDADERRTDRARRILPLPNSKGPRRRLKNKNCQNAGAMANLCCAYLDRVRSMRLWRPFLHIWSNSGELALAPNRWMRCQWLAS